jgi:hypothetical protein
MAGITKYVQWVWELSIATQVAVCAVLFLKGNFRRLPIFTAYVLSNICQAAVFYFTYKEFGYGSRSAALIAWWSQCIPQLLRVLAISEALRLILKPYRGIWALGWRVLVVAFIAVFSVALVGSGRGLSWFVLLADRGFHLAFGFALVACLLLVRYYLIPVHRVYKTLLGGFCFYSCAVVLANTVGGLLFQRGSPNFQMIWQLATVGAFVAVSMVWAVALLAPLPEPARHQGQMAATVDYWDISPRINERLRHLNDQLDRFWRPEVTTQQ